MFMSTVEKELITKISAQELISEGRTIGDILLYVSQLPIEHIQLAGCFYLEAVVFKIKLHKMIDWIGIDSKKQK